MAGYQGKAKRRVGSYTRMGKSMIALQFESPRNPVVGEHSLPSPGPGEVLVRIEAVTTCPHWDIHLIRNEPMFPGVPFTYPYPVGQPGHEALGTVVETGADVEGLEPGTRVVAWRDPGQHRAGSYAQYNVFDQESLLEVSADLNYRSIASLELAMCVQVTFDRLLESNLIRHHRVAISGLGPAGLVAVQMASAYGASEVVGIEPLPQRRETAKELGVSAAFAPDDPHIGNLDRHSTEAFDVAIDLSALVTTDMPLRRYQEGIEKLMKKEAIKICFLPWE